MAIRRPSRKLFVALSLAILGLLTLAGVVAFQSARVSIHRAGTAARFGHIALAMEVYQDTYGCYPPQYLEDPQGRPAHSWRVLLLVVSYPDLYRRYRFDEPWDGPHNRLLAPEMPKDYRSPFVDAKSTITQYVGIVGKETAWRGTTPLRPDDFRSSKSIPVIWLVEAANSDIHWMEPRDIPLEQALEGISVAGGGGIQSNYSDGLPAQMKRSGRDWVPVDISPEVFRSMLTVTDAKDKSRGKVPSEATQRNSP